MPTTNQLTKAPRRKKHKKPNRALQGAPQKSGVITKIKVVDPKKPNSGGRKVARVRLTNGMEVNALIPGIGLGNLQEHSHVLVIAAECPDTPSVRYKVVRGNRDAMPEEFAQSNNTVTGEQRVHGRSKYGSKKPKVR